VNQQHSHPVSELLARSGRQRVAGSAVPLVYNELRDLARYQLQRKRSGRTLQSATLVHQTYLRLLDQRLFNTENRAHSLAVASRLMRQILVVYARKYGAAKAALIAGLNATRRSS
jgi:ECF sigma factor